MNDDKKRRASRPAPRPLDDRQLAAATGGADANGDADPMNYLRKSGE
jgi:hypothetical protein